MKYILHTVDLSKHYGRLRAVESVNLQVRKGEIYGFLGLNGAGKTTTIRMLLGMIRPTRGKAFLYGHEINRHNHELWNRVGHLVEIPYAYPELSVVENLEIFRRLRFLKEKKRVQQVMEALHLSPYRDTKAKNLSLGNAQRLGIAKALIHQPGLLILDEPANGLDPAGIVQVRQLLVDLSRNQGVTIFISSHILGELSKFATRIGIIHEGHLIRESDVEALHASRRRVVMVDTPDNRKAAEVLTVNGYESQQTSEGILELTGESVLRQPEKVSALLAADGLPPKRIGLEEEDLEHYFFRIIQTPNRNEQGI